MYFRINVLFLATILFITGCQQESKESTLPEANKDNQFIQVENSGSDEQMNLDNKEIASHLANIAGNVPNVNNATAVIAGPYAVVGIDVNKELDRSRVGSIKYTVSEALQHDPYGKTAVVVADADVMERIRSMGRDIEQGHPVQGIVDELSAIVGRYMPDFPVDEDTPQKPDQNKENISDEHKKELDDIQKDQSNEN